jgi:hypothetical protein
VRAQAVAWRIQAIYSGPLSAERLVDQRTRARPIAQPKRRSATPRYRQTGRMSITLRMTLRVRTGARTWCTHTHLNPALPPPSPPSVHVCNTPLDSFGSREIQRCYQRILARELTRQQGFARFIILIRTAAKARQRLPRTKPRKRIFHELFPSAQAPLLLKTFCARDKVDRLSMIVHFREPDTHCVSGRESQSVLSLRCC